jgi:CRP/FNR family transcriptional regulator, nitrogen fixation regulation protein
MNANRAGLHAPEAVWTHQPSANSRSTPQALESLAIVSRYQRDEEIYPQQGPIECWYRVISGTARRFIFRADGRRQTVDLLLPGDFFGFGVGGRHAFAAEAIAADAVIARYPVSRIEMLAGSNPRAAAELSGIVVDAMSRLHSLLLILGRTTAEQKVGAFLLHVQERLGSGGTNGVALPVTRYDIADYLALSVETVSRSLTALTERGVIALHGPREIRIIDRAALAKERDAGEAFARPLAVERPVSERRTSHPARHVPRTRSAEVRVPAFAFGSVLSDMRRWLDHERCEPSRFTCVRDGSRAVVVRVEFANENDGLVEAFEQEFVASEAISA